MLYTKHLSTFLCALCAMVFLALPAWADGQRIVLPAPDKSGGKPLMQALAERKATRSFTDAALNQQTLSDLLWATWGISRADGRHTAPTARNQQKVAVYVALPDGIWRYEPQDHAIVREKTGDMRTELGGGAAILIYATPDDRYGHTHVGALYQNAGLYCASAGLGNVVRAQPVPRANDVLKLPEGYQVIMTQGVGWPK